VSSGDGSVSSGTSRGKPKGERRRGWWLPGGPAGEWGPSTGGTRRKRMTSGSREGI
jgi:hypothetical protein